MNTANIKASKDRNHHYKRFPSPLTFLFLSIFSLTLIVSCRESQSIEQGVRVGENNLSKEVFVSDSTIGEVTAIEILQSDSVNPQRILIVGCLGSSLIKANGDIISKTMFDRGGGSVIPVYNPKTQSFDYLNKGGGWQPISYMDNMGKTILKINDPTPNDVTLIDVDKDGTNELVMGSNGNGGLIAFNMNGEQIWKIKTRNSFSVNTFEEEGESKIIHTDKDNILVRSTSGELERTLELPLVKFDICNWPGRNELAIIGLVNDTISAYDFDGNFLSAYKVERRGRVANVAILKNKQNEDKLGAVVCLRYSMGLSEFYVFDSNDSLYFHEVFQAKHPVIKSYTNPADSSKSILVGGSNGTVWIYSYNE
jgi:outer membrane protein assembly factor BamB